MLLSLLHKIHYYQAKLIIFQLVSPVNKIENPSENEKNIIKEGRRWKFYMNRDRYDDLSLYYKDDYETKEQIYELYDFTLSNLKVITKNGIALLSDTQSKYYNVINNKRITQNVPQNFEHNIYFFGHCNAVGCFAEDKDTIASLLQNKVNQFYPEKFAINNCSNWGALAFSLRQMLSPQYTFKKDDLVVLIVHDINLREVNVLLERYFDSRDFVYYENIDSFFERPHDFGEIFLDDHHLTYKGYRFITDKIYDIINREYIAKLGSLDENTLKDKELVEYLDELSDIYIYMKHGKKIGSIVMNANPFTNGHLFLVNEALKQCDYLIVFVLEEDRSYFKFVDRFEIVKNCLKQYDNVFVVRSGKYIISQTTLPEYFTKESNNDVVINATSDLEFFSKYIAKKINISMRFVGNEPICNITSQYNVQMKKVLPQYGISVIEIPRLIIDDNVVSASLVRKYISENNYEEIKKIVPLETYKYLLEKEYLVENKTFLDKLLRKIQ